MCGYIVSYDGNAGISLHDCRATSVSAQDGCLCFEFGDGFWRLRGNGEGCVKTGRSYLRVNGFDCISVYIFKELRVFGRLICTRRVEIKLDTLIRRIMSGTWELEFLYTYRGYKETLFSCCLWSGRTPYHRECELLLGYEDMQCLWDDVCEDKPW